MIASPIEPAPDPYLSMMPTIETGERQERDSAAVEYVLFAIRQDLVKRQNELFGVCSATDWGPFGSTPASSARIG
jgi:hypothetical protein